MSKDNYEVIHKEELKSLRVLEACLHILIEPYQEALCTGVPIESTKATRVLNHWDESRESIDWLLGTEGE